MSAGAAGGLVVFPKLGQGMQRHLLLLLLPLAVLGAACRGGQGGQPDLSATIGSVRHQGEAGPCQAVFVAPDRALTAAHCVVDRRSWRARAPNEMTIVVADRTFVVREVALPAKPALAPSGEILDLQEDWAILHVEVGAEGGAAPLPLAGGRAARLAFVFREPVVKAAVTRSADGRESATHLARCGVREVKPDGRLLTYGCAGDAGPGLSGSPLLLETGAGYEVIGVMAAKERLPSGEEVGIVVVPPAGEIAAGAGRR